MTKSTLLVVHGTGVRSESFGETLKQIRLKVKEFHLPCVVEPILWGETLGIDFEGLSLPDPPAHSDEEESHALRWQYLQVDPLFDLRLWCIPAAEPAKKVLGETPTAVAAWEDTISKYVGEYAKRIELATLLSNNQLDVFFLPAWNKVVASQLPKQAFAAAGEDGPAVSRVFAEAVVAQMMHDAAAANPPVALPPQLGTKIVAIMIFDWQQARLGIKNLFLKFFGSAAKTVIRPLRAGASLAIAPAIGDILNYQAVGQKLRDLIRRKIELTGGDVFVLSHSLGGIACFELMVEERGKRADALGNVKGLITVGSQAPLLYEFGALQTLKKGSPLPASFPGWLNIFDENDLLSYRADRLFGEGHDKQVDSMLPPLEAHSAYWKLDETWNAIGAHMDKALAGKPHG